ncbi:helix-turn-helix domain-containing protein [Ochrovirga pacifica]|uniref:helix-turn-helix domain-containing protein n=1 Tax=Ochrovirga pacifica TaxID=1042376 RepID=UPI001ED9094D
MSQQVFADLFDLKRATLGAYEEGRSEPKIDTIIKVANYFSISIDDMLTKEVTVNQLLSFDGGITTDIHQVMKNALVKVPFVAALNLKRFTENFPKTQSYADLPTLTLPIKENENYLAFETQDLTMVVNHEGLFLHDVVVGTRVLASEIKKGEVLIVLHKSDLFVRRYQKNETHHLLKADHIHVPIIEIDINDEVYFWKVTEVLLKRYPKFTSGIEDKINQIMNKLNDQ